MRACLADSMACMTVFSLRRALAAIVLLVCLIAVAACGGQGERQAATFTSSLLHCSFQYPAWFDVGQVQPGIDGSMKVVLTDPATRSRVTVYRESQVLAQIAPAQALATMRAIRRQGLGKRLVAFTTSRVVAVHGLHGFILGDIDVGTSAAPLRHPIESEQWTLWDSKATYTVFLFSPASNWKADYGGLEMVPETLQPR